METKLASYQEPGVRLQLIKIYEEIDEIIQEKPNIKPHKSGYKIKVNNKYQIRKNRKIICTFKWESPARQKFLKLIQDELLQTSINYEEKQ